VKKLLLETTKQHKFAVDETLHKKQARGKNKRRLINKFHNYGIYLIPFVGRKKINYKKISFYFLQ